VASAGNDGSVRLGERPYRDGKIAWKRAGFMLGAVACFHG
jgi:hypothetical protein